MKALSVLCVGHREATVVWRQQNTVHRVTLGIRYMVGIGNDGSAYYVTARGCCINSDVPDNFCTLVLSHTETRNMLGAEATMHAAAANMVKAARADTFKAESDVVEWLSIG